MSTGNIRNDELVKLFVANVDRLVVDFEASHFAELSCAAIIVH